MKMRILALLLCSCLYLTGISFQASAKELSQAAETAGEVQAAEAAGHPQADLTEEPAAGTNANRPAAGVKVAYRTQKEIADYIKSSGAGTEDALTFQTEPKTDPPYDLGRLSDETLASALKMLNQIRYIAGISYHVELSEELNRQAQAAALANYANGALSHSPARPDGMTDEMYALASKGASSSNIAWASWAGRSLNETSVFSWMNDGDSGNISAVGHRRWMLNPSMGKTGFGAVSGGKGTYSAISVFDRSNTSANEYGVMWPAQNMPVSYFRKSYPWTVSMDRTIHAADVKVRLVRRNDGRVWNFSAGSSDGYFNVNNVGYGQIGCIIFRPDPETIENFLPGDIYDVTITGASEETISYSVSFFDLENPAEENVSVTSVSLDRQQAEIKEKGQTVKLAAAVAPENASNKNVAWESSNPSVATVDAEGTVYAVSNGTAVITVTTEDGKKTASCTVTVEIPLAAGGRISGYNRYETAIQCAELIGQGEKFTSVVIANADNFPDALAGCPLAAQNSAPILLTGKSASGTRQTMMYVKDHLEKEGTVYLLGGISAVSEDVEAELRAAGFDNIKRLGGSTRYETNLMIIDEMKVAKGSNVVIVSGANYADSLSVSGIAGAEGMPVFLAGEALTEEQVKRLAQIEPSNLYMIGGTAAVSAAAEEQAEAFGSVVRISGKNRYATSLAVAEYFQMDEAAYAVFACGNNFPDGLTGGALAAGLNAPVILVSDTNYTEQEAFLKNSRIEDTFIMGGTSVISAETEKHLRK